MNSIMLDIETLDTKPTAAILSIAAVEFDMETGDTGKEFYTNVDLQSCIDAGLTISADTLHWWMQQSDNARHEIFINPQHIQVALVELRKFFADKNYIVWANPPQFDLVILRNAYHKCGITPPWNWRDERCLRTLVSLAPHIKQNHPQNPNPHNALADCLHQTGYCSKTYQSITAKPNNQ